MFTFILLTRFPTTNCTLTRLGFLLRMSPFLTSLLLNLMAVLSMFCYLHVFWKIICIRTSSILFSLVVMDFRFLHHNSGNLWLTELCGLYNWMQSLHCPSECIAVISQLLSYSLCVSITWWLVIIGLSCCNFRSNLSFLVSYGLYRFHMLTLEDLRNVDCQVRY